MPSKLKICEIHLRNFRSFKEAKVIFSKDLVFFTGENGTGKTTLLEAMSVIAHLRSFRKVRDEKLISWGEDHYAISLSFVEDETKTLLHAGYSLGKGRSLLVNREKVNQLTNFLGRLPVVVFSPDDLGILEGGPAERRRFLDILLSSLSHSYLAALQNYQRLLRQRSVLLRRGVIDKKVFAAIDQELAKNGALIIKNRSEFVSKYHPSLNHYVQLISSGKDSWNMHYKPSIPEGEDEKNYFNYLEKHLTTDLKIKQTANGIHRDRLFFCPPEKPQTDLEHLASQGQKRTLALALKMAQFTYFKENLGKIPILLVDDVLNELDMNRRKAFVSFLGGIGQAFFTTTDIGEIHEFLEKSAIPNPAEIYELKKENGISQVFRKTL